MAPSALQAKINAFEALSSSSTSAKSPQPRSPPDILERPISPAVTSYSPITPSKPISSSSPPKLGRKPSLIDLGDWVVENGPLPYVPRQKNVPNIKAATSNAPRSVSDSLLKPSTSVSTPLINLESPPNSRPTAPPLPPRKPSYTSLRSVSASNSSTSSLARSPNRPNVSLPPPLPRKQDSLTVDHTYPPWSKLGIAIPSRSRSDNPGHVPTSSISSFHSVSLSSDGGTDPRTPGGLSVTTEFSKDDNGIPESPVNIREADAASLDESYENVSLPSAISPTVSSITQHWEAYRARAEPPKLPQRPKATRSVPSSPSLTATKSPPPVPRLSLKQPPPPPPPLRSRPPSTRGSQAPPSAVPTPTVPSAPSSDRSSILSTSTAASSSRTSLSGGGTRPAAAHPPKPGPRPGPLARPTPIPLPARQRYENVFTVNVLAQRRAATAQERARSPPPGRKRQAAGWRGLSVDLITNPAEAPAGQRADGEAGVEDRLEGRTVRLIWEMSKLDRARLRAIWSECDPDGAGTLDRQGFVKGMWRIDEELRRAELSRQTSTAARFRQPLRMQSRPILQ
ncbi:hypothetical protein OBBRIDRAFT_810901 [Obba rivulosa]|uniref:EH domain-containing protein n=1 Tax=Obba rivulosa TaxID=1052685 RepID=A0A8E2DQC1_9APHY|nr:hypothetical protein OBBRIDRAFT_810901 [Obba rivulosa]